MQMASYGKLCTEVYDLDKPEAPPKMLDFYLGKLERANGPVLEPMCGSGRFLIPLLNRGIDIHGVDASFHMLQACRDKAAVKGLEPVLHKQFLHELSLPMRYGFMFIPDGSFGLIVDKQEVSESLQRLYKHLLPGGKLVLDIEMPRARSKPNGERKWGGKWGGGWVTRPDGAKIVVSNLGMEYDPDEQIQATISRYELFKKGRLVETELEDFVLRYYERDEFQSLLETAGFAGIRVARPHDDGVEPGDEDSTIMFECRRYS